MKARLKRNVPPLHCLTSCEQLWQAGGGCRCQAMGLPLSGVVGVDDVDEGNLSEQMLASVLVLREVTS